MHLLFFGFYALFLCTWLGVKKGIQAVNYYYNHFMALWILSGLPG